MRRPFAYTIARSHRRYLLIGSSFFTIESRNVRIRTRAAYRDMRRAGVGKTQARTIVCELLSAGQAAVSYDPLTSTLTVVMGTHSPQPRHQRPAVAA